MVPEANVPMFSAVKVPEALLLLVAVREDRVATVDWVPQDEAMLRETESPTDQESAGLGFIVIRAAASLLKPDNENALFTTQKFSALRAALACALKLI